jgi:hypothetical protein
LQQNPAQIPPQSQQRSITTAEIEDDNRGIAVSSSSCTTPVAVTRLCSVL